MVILAKIQFRIMITTFVLLMIPSISSCNNVYTGKHFSFPPESNPHENNWQYAGQVIVSSNQTPITKKSKKNIQIKIYDKNKTVFLNDDFQFISASIDTNVLWEKFEEIRIELFEVGNKYAKDSYNQRLLKAGPKSLLILKYQYDRKKKKFMKWE